MKLFELIVENEEKKEIDLSHWDDRVEKAWVEKTDGMTTISFIWNDPRADKKETVEITQKKNEPYQEFRRRVKSSILDVKPRQKKESKEQTSQFKKDSELRELAKSLVDKSMDRYPGWIWLSIPYRDKDKAKQKFGRQIKWNADRKKWYITTDEFKILPDLQKAGWIKQ